MDKKYRIEFTDDMENMKLYINGEEKPINFGFTKHAWTTTSLKPINMKKHFPELYQKMEAIKEP